MKRDQQQYHRRSIRLQRYDYSQEGAYFVTICTYNSLLLFADVQINDIGEQCLLEIPGHFPKIDLDEWIIMPDHLHVILVITDQVKNVIRRGTACRAPTPAHERFGRPTSGSLPTVVRSFKSAAARRINVVRNTPGARVWQRNYYERVIRNEEELNRLRQYILDNPVQWEMDEDNLSAHRQSTFKGESLCRIK